MQGREGRGAVGLSPVIPQLNALRDLPDQGAKQGLEKSLRYEDGTESSGTG